MQQRKIFSLNKTTAIPKKMVKKQRLGHYVNDPCRLFVVFNVTKCITGAVNDDISFSGDTEREVVVLSFLLASPTETGKNKTEGEYEFE